MRKQLIKEDRLLVWFNNFNDYMLQKSLLQLLYLYIISVIKTVTVINSNLFLEEVTYFISKLL